MHMKYLLLLSAALTTFITKISEGFVWQACFQQFPFKSPASLALAMMTPTLAGPPGLHRLTLMGKDEMGALEPCPFCSSTLILALALAVMTPTLAGPPGLHRLTLMGEDELGALEPCPFCSCTLILALALAVMTPTLAGPPGLHRLTLMGKDEMGALEPCLFLLHIYPCSCTGYDDTHPSRPSWPASPYSFGRG